jgi:hypothetical protein
LTCIWVNGRTEGEKVENSPASSGDLGLIEEKIVIVSVIGQSQDHGLVVVEGEEIGHFC